MIMLRHRVRVEQFHYRDDDEDGLLEISSVMKDALKAVLFIIPLTDIRFLVGTCINAKKLIVEQIHRYISAILYASTGVQTADR